MPDLGDKEVQMRRRRARQALAAANEPMLAPPIAGGLPDYTELHCLTNFSFQRSASHPGELAARAWRLQYRGLAITDECSVAGVVRAMSGLKEYIEALDEEERRHPERPKTPRNPDFRLLYGSEFVFERFTLVALARNLTGWGHLCELITHARMHADKGSYRLDWEPQRLAGLQEAGPDLVDVDLRPFEAVAVPELVDDVQQGDAGAAQARQRLRMRQGEAGGGAAVERHEQA